MTPSVGEWANRNCNENTEPKKQANGKMQSHQGDREVYANQGADPVLINVTPGLYPNCNGLWSRLEDSILALLQCANCSWVACGIAMQKTLCKANGRYLLLSSGLVFRGAKQRRSQV